MAQKITTDEEGKPVVYGDDTIGRVVEVRSETAYVDPDPSVAQSIMSKFGWAEAGEDAFPLQDELVRSVDDDAVRLETEL